MFFFLSTSDHLIGGWTKCELADNLRKGGVKANQIIKEIRHTSSVASPEDRVIT